VQVDRLHPGRVGPRAFDVAVVIDVLRATTTASVLLSRGVDVLPIVATPADLADLPPNAGGCSYLIFSEMEAAAEHAERVDNSPSIAEGIELDGRTPVLVTTNGTRAVHAVLGQSRAVLLASFVNLSAVVRHLLALGPRSVTLVPAGHFSGQEKRIEDERCADALERLLHGQAPGLEGLVAECLADPRIRRRQSREANLARDVSIAFTPDRFGTVIEVVRAGEGEPCFARPVRETGENDPNRSNVNG
jgi:phosphosulfolactate phosphohydrolase-like enzyme